MDYSCTGDVTIDGGSVLTLTGDITFTVNGTLTVTGAGSKIAANAANTYVSIIATDVVVDSNALIDANGFGCGSTTSFNTGTNSGCINNGTANYVGFGEGADDTASLGGGGGAGYAGAGGRGATNSGGGVGGNRYGSADLAVMMLGSGGGKNVAGNKAGGAGGGAILLQVSGTLTNNGTISANGGDGIYAGGYGSGGGSGGSIKIIADSLAGTTGLMTVNGGNGGVNGNYGGGGGGGGRIYIEYTTANNYTGSYSAQGGAKGGGPNSGNGSVGSVVVTDTAAMPNAIVGGFGSLTDTLDSSNDGTMNFTTLSVINAGGSGTMTLSGNAHVVNATTISNNIAVAGNLTVDNSLNINGGLSNVSGNVSVPTTLNISGGTLRMNGDSVLTATQLDVASTLQLNANTTYSSINVTILNVTGTISADGYGCGSSKSYDYTVTSCVSKGSTTASIAGFGEGGDVTNTGWYYGGGGGGYGGAGGNGELGANAGIGGNAYGTADLLNGGSVITPYQGSGGGIGRRTTTSLAGGAGGGAIKLMVSGTATINGTISANGGDGAVNLASGGGGSGGGIYLNADILAGSGVIRANGGNGNGNAGYKGGGGGGGRIYVSTSSVSSHAVSFQTAGGSGAVLGNDGTIIAGVNGIPYSVSSTTEAGGTAVFNIALEKEPTVDVTINFANSDSTEGVLSTPSMLFTGGPSGNWNTPQTLTVTGQNDFFDDGDVNYSVTLTASTTDPFYSAVVMPTIRLVNLDDADTVGVTINPVSGLTTSETGTTASFTVRLDSEPFDTVTIDLVSSDTTEGNVTTPVSGQLTFLPGNWNVDQTVTITGVDDVSFDGNVAYSIITTSSSAGDPAYDNLAVSDVSLINTDDDTVSVVGVTVTPTAGRVTSEIGAQTSFSVVLDSEPTGPVIIDLLSSDLTEGDIIVPASKQFTFTGGGTSGVGGNWNIPQTVTITGFNDTIEDGPVDYTIVITASSGSDTNYNGLSVVDVTVTNTDNSLFQNSDWKDGIPISSFACTLTGGIWNGVSCGANDTVNQTGWDTAGSISPLLDFNSEPGVLKLAATSSETWLQTDDSTTERGFSLTGATQTNMTVSGSGDAASLLLDNSNPLTGIEADPESGFIFDTATYDGISIQGIVGVAPDIRIYTNEINHSGKFNFASFTVRAGHSVTVKGTGSVYTGANNPLDLKVKGNVVIDGQLHADGETSLDQRIGGYGGPGGFDGGRGQEAGISATNGQGPGGGGKSNNAAGGGGGFGGYGGDAVDTIYVNGGDGGGVYNNAALSEFVFPLNQGGSGGGGSYRGNRSGSIGAPGGGGGGAVHILSEGSITIGPSGVVTANGGGGGTGTSSGHGGAGGGSGGSVNLYGVQGVVNNGLIQAIGGNGSNGRPVSGGSNSYGGGGGGGGRILLTAPTGQSVVEGTINVNGGTSSASGNPGGIGAYGSSGSILAGSTNFPQTGNYISAIHQFSGSGAWSEINWSEVVPTGASLAVYVRSCSLTDCSDRGTNWSLATNNSDISALSYVQDGHRYFQYKVEMVSPSPAEVGEGHFYAVPGSITQLPGGVHRYDSFTIPANATVKITGTEALTLFVEGAVTIDGSLLLNGEDGLGSGTGGLAGAGGGAGGGNSENGFGQGGGYTAGAGGGGGSFGNDGGAPTKGQYNFPDFSEYVWPLNAGGSGGGGGYGNVGGGRSPGGGGGGGGAVKIAANGAITIGATGLISANGGNGGAGSYTYSKPGGGGGSGGGIFLISSHASGVVNQGSILATGGSGGPSAGTASNGGEGGSGGRIYIEAATISNTGTINLNGGVFAGCCNNGADGTYTPNVTFVAPIDTGINKTFADKTPRLNDISIRLDQYPAQDAELISSVFDSEHDQNLIKLLTWTADTPTGTSVKFQLRTSPNGSTNPADWSAWYGPNSTFDYYETPGTAINAIHADGVADRYFQYKVILNSTNSARTPKLYDVSVEYETALNVVGKPMVWVTTLDGTAVENSGDTATFLVARAGDIASPLVVNYSVSGSATSGTDFVALSGNVTIPAGQVSATFSLVTLGDALTEGIETVTVTINNDLAYMLSSSIQSTAVIVDDETSGGILVTPVSGLVTTEAGGTASFNVQLTSQPAQPVFIDLFSSDDSEGSISTSMLTFLTTNWNTPQTVTISGLDDSQVDGDIDFTIVTNPARSVGPDYQNIDAANISVTNQDDDVIELPRVSILANDALAAEAATPDPGVFTISRTGSTASPLTVIYSMAGSATNANDYNDLLGSAIIPAGNNSVDVTLTPIDDGLVENDEAALMTLVPNAFYQIDLPYSAAVVITDDESAVSANFAIDQKVEEGTAAAVNVTLSRAANAYPVTIPYTISGTAINPDDHDAADGSIVINAGTTGGFTFSTVADGTSEGDETIIVSMGTPTNASAGIRSTHTVHLTDLEVAPSVKLSTVQGGVNTHLVVKTDGNVIVSTTVTDVNIGDNHSYDWSASNNNLVDIDADPTTFTFDPTSLNEGFYAIRLTVTDDSPALLATSVEMLLHVVATAPVLTSADSDGDGMADNVEGTADTDGDGIPDYLDTNLLANNMLQTQPLNTTSYLMRVDEGLTLALGGTSFVTGSDAAYVTDLDIATYGGSEGTVGLNGLDSIPHLNNYSFKVTGLPLRGQSVRIVIPQQQAIPTGARYRKYFAATGWQDFVVDVNNAIYSAPGEPGICPLPGHAAYTAGLTAGYYCIQLMIEDGGPNDIDGMVNYEIEDPGAVGVIEPVNNTPASTSGGGGSIEFVFVLFLGIGLVIVIIRARKDSELSVGSSLAMLTVLVLTNAASAEPVLNWQKQLGPSPGGSGATENNVTVGSLMSEVVNIGGQEYWHQIIGDQFEGFALEVYVEKTGARRAAAMNTGGCSGGIVARRCSGSNPLSVPNGMGSENPGKVIMRQVVFDAEMTMEVYKPLFDMKHRVTQYVNDGEINSTFIADMTGIGVGDIGTRADVTNTLNLKDPAVPADSASWDMATDSDVNYVTAGRWMYIPGTCPDCDAGGGGSYTYIDGPSFDASTVDWASFFRPGQEANNYWSPPP
ncbi:MAG: Calx-beta domain-containing protein [Gammaproteobacteria bacterium]